MVENLLVVSLLPKFRQSVFSFVCLFHCRLKVFGLKLSPSSTPWVSRTKSRTLGGEMECGKEGPLRVERAGLEVLLQHPPCCAVACCILKKAKRGLCYFKYQVVFVLHPRMGHGEEGFLRRLGCSFTRAHRAVQAAASLQQSPSVKGKRDCDSLCKIDRRLSAL